MIITKNKDNRTNQRDINELYRYPIFFDVEELFVKVAKMHIRRKIPGNSSNQIK